MKDDGAGKENEAENIRVAVRCRPMNERELREQAVSCFQAENGNAVLTNLENPSERHEFGFDHVYGIDTPQFRVFDDIGAPILDRAFGGYNGTIFAYGQTGSGKTFSMTGVRGNEELEGLIPRMNKAIFERVKKEKTEDPNKLFLVECSFFEIYNEIIYDLLDSSGNSKKNKGGLEIKEHAVLGIYVKDLQERVVESRDEVIDLMTQGQLARTVGATNMNAESSRSHSIFVIKIHQKDAVDESKNIFAKINLVDLAGSERAASTGAQGDRLKEGANINKSLSALGNVINALVEASRTGKKVFIPYRNSKLTRVLQESLGGNSLCSMLATLSPANINFVETLSTLKYASRAKSIKVNAKKNEASSQISQLNEEIAALKKKLQEQTSTSLGLDPKEKEEIVRKYEMQIKEMDRVRLQTWEDKARLSKQHEMERKRLAKEKALADQRIREERTRKWKLLEEKGDVELMLRALRDLDRSAVGGCNQGVQTPEDKWLARAQALKATENEAKDHRTLIMVFKDAVDKDVEQWTTRVVQQDRKDSANTAARRDDSATSHMIANQLCSKLQNVFNESKLLVQMEKKMMADCSEMINEMMAEMITFKHQRAASKTNKQTASTSTGEQPSSKEEDQAKEEREKGLSIILALVQRQRAKLVSSLRTERQKMMNLTKVTTQFLAYMESRATSEKTTAGVGSPWIEGTNKLKQAAELWETEMKSKFDGSGDTIVASYAPLGDVCALGLESRLVPDECLFTSSRKSDAKYIRMNSSQFWGPEEQDLVPFVVIDLEFPRFLRAVAIKGWNGYSGAGGSTGDVQTNQNTPSTTFELRPAEELKEILKKYTPESVTGDHESTHEILSHAMSWMDLLKTNVVPVKLFARPPVRFLHDVISSVIRNTGYAKGLFSPSEQDYANLPSKTERSDYLTKILDFVQETYTKQAQSESDHSTIIIAATASNILAGKEPTDTLKFLCLFALASLQYAVQHPPPPATVVEKEAGQNLAGEVSKEDTSPEVVEPLRGARSQGYVKKLRVSTSLTGKQWRVIGDFDVNLESEPIDRISFNEDVNAVGRFIQLTCIEWHVAPLLQVELFGQEARETDELVRFIETMGTKANALLENLLGTASLIAEEAKTSWERAKDAERAKQEELVQLMAEITKLKQANAKSDKEIKELQQCKSTLQQNVNAEKQRCGDEKAKNEKLQKELDSNVSALGEMKKEKEALSVLVNEHAHSVQTLQLQLSERDKQVQSLQRTKCDLEELCASLRGQLQSKDVQDGRQESKLASVMSDLMSVNVQLEEYRRKFEASEQMRKEQDKASQDLHGRIQQQLAEMAEKERKSVDVLQRKLTEAENALEGLKAERDKLHQMIEDHTTRETALQASNEALDIQMTALREELETWRKEAAREASSPSKAQLEESMQVAQLEAVQALADANEKLLRNEKMLLEAQTRELRLTADIERLELRLQSQEEKQKDMDSRLQATLLECDQLTNRIKEMEDREEEWQLQLQVVTEERDAARSKEEELFAENNEKDQEIERIRDGYGGCPHTDDDVTKVTSDYSVMKFGSQIE
ncbi:hypothetical protein PINS_up013453 [Pythium insidiosum]|nr:hypothetical protein PINS_up013453 [Pythium insidiosum]